MFLVVEKSTIPISPKLLDANRGLVKFNTISMYGTINIDTALDEDFKVKIYETSTNEIFVLEFNYFKKLLLQKYDEFFGVFLDNDENFDIYCISPQGVMLEQMLKYKFRRILTRTEYQELITFGTYPKLFFRSFQKGYLYGHSKSKLAHLGEYVWSAIQYSSTFGYSPIIWSGDELILRSGYAELHFDVREPSKLAKMMLMG